MTQRERFLKAARREKPDRVPVAPYMGNYGAALAGVKIRRYNRDPKVMAEAQIRAQELVGQDVVVAQSDQYYIAQGFGVQIEQPEDTTPHLVRPAADSLDAAARLPVPDPYNDGRMAVYLEAVSLLRAHYGADMAIRGPGTGPFSLASYLAGGTENFLMEIAMADADEDLAKRRLIHEVMHLAAEALIAFLKALVSAGSDIAQAGDSLASLSMISPAIYDEYVYPYEVKVFEAVNPLAHARGAVTLLHICGDTTAILPKMATTGADILEIDSMVDLAWAKATVGDRVALMGNLEPSALLLQGRPAAVEAAARRAIADAAGTDGGFILGSGCEVPPLTPLENMRAMVKAVGAD